MVLPETEGFTLEEIEEHFAAKERRVTDIKISNIRRHEVTLPTF